MTGDALRSDGAKAPFWAAWERPLSSFDVRLANNAAEVAILLPEKSRKLCAAHSDRVKSQRSELRPQLGCLQCLREPANELGDLFVRRLCRSQHPQPVVHLRVAVARLSDGRQFG